MKKFLKKFSFLIAIVICFGLAGPIMAPLCVFAEPDPEPVAGYTVANEDGIIIPDFKPEGAKGIPYTIAEGYVGSPANRATVSVKDFYGRDVTLIGDTNSFIPQNAGIYYVTYAYGEPEGVNYQSTTLKVNVSNTTKGVEISFEENSEQIVPSIINPKKDAGEGYEITLPNPVVLDAEGEVIDEAVVTRDLIFNGSGDAGTDYKLLEANTTGNDGDFDILVMNPESNGTYTISYKYLVDGKLVAYTQKTIKADLNYDNDFEFTYNYNSNIPESAEIGVATKLPTIIAKNITTQKDDQVEVYYTVKAELVTGTTITYELGDENDVITFKDGAYYFTPIKDGDYVITYTVKNFFGKTASVSSTSFEIEGVKDSIAPVPVVVMPYTEADFEDGVLNYVEATEALANNQKPENIFVFPIYATDAANGIVEDNLTLYRTIKDTTGTIIFDESVDMPEDDKDLNVNGKILVFNSTIVDFETKGDGDTVFTVYLKGVSYEIKKSEVYIVPDDALNKVIGSKTYTISYVAEDKSKHTSKATQPFPIALSADFLDEEAPVVTFSENLPTAIMLDEEVKFIAPTASDNKDSRLSVYLTYITTTGGVDSAEIRADAEDSIITYDKDTNYYKFKVTDNEVSQIKIIASSRDNSGNIGNAEQTVLVLRTGDTGITTIDSIDANIVQNNERGYIQGNEILLPTVVYNDDLVDYLNVEITIENDGVLINSYDASIIRSGETLTLSNAKFFANLKGDYVITYISTDAGNNKTILVFNLLISTNPEDIIVEFTGLDTQINGGKAERNETIKLPIPNLVYDETELELVDGSYKVVITGLANYELYSNYLFKPKKPGTYYIKYIADFKVIDSPEFPFETVESRTFQIEVTDTIAPEIENLVEIGNFFDELNAEGVEPNTVLNIRPPYCNADDLDLEASYVKVSTTTASSYTIYLNEIDELTDFNKFTRNDTYTISYVLIDKYDNETQKTFQLNVGDCEPPVFTGLEDLFESEYALNEEIIVDLSKITVKDEVDGEILIYNEDDNTYSVLENASFTITIKNVQTGDVVKNDLEIDNDDLRFQFTIKTAGEYKVTIEAKDTAGQTATEELTFIVAADNNAGMTAEEILGTILIIVSLLLLGGVITYFVVSKKKLENKYKK